MNKNLLIGIVAVVILVGVGYFFFMNNSDQTTKVVPAAEDMTVVSEPVITLVEQNASGEMGTTTFVEENGKVKVTINVTGGLAGVSQPAHIHVGACPDVGAVKYPLTSVVNGVSETVIDATFDQLRAQQPLGLNVHKSAAEASVYVSCGDLAF